jgi:hypothetical protein
MEKWRQWEAASKADWGTAVERESVIRALAEEGLWQVSWKFGPEVAC